MTGPLMGDELVDALMRLAVVAQREGGSDLRVATREVIEAFRKADERLRDAHANDPEVKNEWTRVNKELRQGLESLDVGARHFEEGMRTLGALLIEEGRRRGT